MFNDDNKDASRRPSRNIPRMIRENSNRSSSSISMVAELNKPRASLVVPNQKKRGLSFTNVVRIAAMNKKLGKPPRSRKTSESMGRENDSEEEFVEDLEIPKTPRFASMLSDAGQFAALKCYEDLILNGIKDDVPGSEKQEVQADKQEVALEGQEVTSEEQEVTPRKPWMPPGGLIRVSSPNQYVSAIHIKPKPLNRKCKAQNLLNPATLSKTSIASTALSQNNNNSSDDNFKPNSDPNKGSNAGNSEVQKGALDDPKSALDDPKLRLSCRFQTAMDILDHIKLREGQVITTPRDRFHRVRDMDKQKVFVNYNRWSRNWCQDFKYELCKKPMKQTVKY